MIKLKKLLAGAALFAAATLSSTAVYANGDIVIVGTDGEEVEGDKAPNGVYVGNISVGGMNASEIGQAIDEYINKVNTMTLTVSSEKGSIQLPISGMSLVCNNRDELVETAIGKQHAGNLISQYKQSKDLECNNLHLDINFSVDAAGLAGYLLSQIPELESSPVNPTITMNDDGSFSFVEGKNGFAIDYDGTYNAVCKALGTYDGSTDTIMAEVVGSISECPYSASVFEGFGDVLGEWKTEFETSGYYADRAVNVRLAASKINGTVLMPGETFSFCASVQPFTEEEGYKKAGTYMDGQTVDDLGGGVCQVSSTLYNAVLWAELGIPEGGRKPHSKSVVYVKPAMDAMVYVATNSDFKFTNTTDHAVYIQAYTTGDRLKEGSAEQTVADVGFRIYGAEYRPENRTIDYESIIVSEEMPDPVYNVKNDDANYVMADVPLKPNVTNYIQVVEVAHKTIKAKLIKHVYVDGVEQGEPLYIHTDTYRGNTGTIMINSKTVLVSYNYDDEFTLTDIVLSNVYAEAEKNTTHKETTTKKPEETKKEEPSTEKPSETVPQTEKPSETVPQTEKPSETAPQPSSELPPETVPAESTAEPAPAESSGEVTAE